MPPKPDPQESALATVLATFLEESRRREEAARLREEAAQQREEEILQRLERLTAGGSTITTRTDVANVIAALAGRIVTFEYDEEAGCTFEKWICRFEDVVKLDGSTLKEDDRRSLLLSKLDSRSYSMLVDHLLPKTPLETKYEDLKGKLTTLFGEKTSVFRRRYNAFHVVKSASEDFKTYATRVNQLHERGRIKEMSDDQSKCMLFVAGLQEVTYKELRKKLIRQLETNDKATLQDLLTECDLSTTLAKDAEVGTELNKDAVVQKVRQKPTRRKIQRKRVPSKDASPQKDQEKGKTSECFTCGQLGHWARNCPKSQVRPKRNVRSIVTVGQIDKDQKEAVVNIAGEDIRMQVDTGAAVTILDEGTWNRLGSPKLNKSSVQLKAANGSEIATLGEFETTFRIKDYTGKGKCFVTKDILLLGIDWIDQLPPFKNCFDAVCCTVKKQGTLVSEIFENFPNVFKEELGKCTKVRPKLVLKKDAVPVYVPKRKVPFAVEDAVNKELDRLVEIGVLTPVSYSRWAAPIVPVKKKTGQVRVCADYSTGLNDALELNRHPLPTAEEIFTRLNGGSVFSQVDLRDAYLQLEMDDASKELLTINTSRGLYRYNRLPFGVKSAPGIFQELMDNLIAGIDGCAAYLDDIIVCGRSQEEHDDSIRRLFERIEEYGIRVRLEKCAFGQPSIKFLGFIVDKDGRRPDSEKTAAIEKMPIPKNLGEVESFLGMVSFYSAFVPKMRELRAPLDELKKKGAKFVWTKDCEKAFNGLRTIINSKLLLCHYNPNLPIIVATDASEKGIGAVITHRLPNGKEKAIWHASRALTSAEKNYSQTEKEGLAIVFGIKKFHRYLYGREFTLLTDHRPLLSIFGNKKGIPAHTANRLQRWALMLLGYDFKIEYRSTHAIGQADALSRLIPQRKTSSDEDIVIANVEVETSAEFEETLERLPVTMKDIATATVSDFSLPVVKRAVISGKWPNGSPGSILYNFRSQKEKLSVYQECLFVGNRVVIPQKLKQRVLRMLHDGHPGQTRMKLLARTCVYWTGIDRDIERMVQRCRNCQLAAKLPAKNTLTAWPETSRPMERVHCDFAGPLNGKMYLIVVDAFSRWPEIVEMTTTTATATIRQLESLFSRFGAPETLVSDNGTQFTAALFENFCKMNNIKHIRTPPFHPQSNGLAERFVDTFKRALIKLGSLGSTRSTLEKFLQTYRATPVPSATKCATPAELFIGRKIRTPVTSLAKDVQTKKTKRERREPTTYEQGDAVFVRDYRTPSKPRWTEGEVVEQLGKVMYKVKIAHGVIWTRHRHQLRKRVDKKKLEVLLDEFKLSNNQQSSSDNTTMETVNDSTFARPLSDETTYTTTCDENDSDYEGQMDNPTTPRPGPDRMRTTTQRMQVDPTKKSYT